MMNVDDIRRVNRSVFTLSPTTETTLRKHYATGFRFVVAQLKTGGKMHPLAYISSVLDNTLFVPTRHEHGDEVDTYASGSKSPFSWLRSNLPHWDHSIYVMHSNNRSLRVDFSGNVERQDAMGLPVNTLVTIEVDKIRHKNPGCLSLLNFTERKIQITKLSIHGQQPNTDILVQLG